MPEVPKIVRERLRNVPGAEMPGPHPDANLLAAFAEQALSTSEREQVLAHLATCEDCRTALLLALPPMETVAAPHAAAEPETAAISPPPKQGWFSRPIFAWPTLRWGALAAGVVVAAALLVHYSGNSNPAQLSQHTISEPKSTESKKPAPETALKSETAATHKFVFERDKALTDDKRADVVSKLDAPAFAQNRPVVNTKDVVVATEPLAKKQLFASAPPATNDALAGKVGARPAAPASAHDAVEVSGATGGLVQTEESPVANRVAPSSTEQVPLSASNEMTLARNKEAAPPITRAKPATAAEQSAPMPMAKAAPQPAGTASSITSAKWSLSSGMLRRSIDGGATWQTSLPDGRLLCYAPRADDIWAGGKSGLLFHSTDNGATWSQVHPSVGDRSLTDDVTHLEVRSAAEVVLSTSNGETWTSSDGGKTWSTR